MMYAVVVKDGGWRTRLKCFAFRSDALTYIRANSLKRDHESVSIESLQDDADLFYSINS